jgi:hypothetical protein
LIGTSLLRAFFAVLLPRKSPGETGVSPVERMPCRRTRKPARASSSITPKKAKPRISAKKAGA